VVAFDPEQEDQGKFEGDDHDDNFEGGSGGKNVANGRGFGNAWGEVPVPTAGDGQAGEVRVWVSGSGMGQKGRVGGKPKAKAKKVVKRKGSDANAEAYLVEEDGKGNFFKAELGVDSNVAVEDAFPEPERPPKPPKQPRRPWELRWRGWMRTCISFFLDRRQMLIRPPNGVKYDEVVTALLYWNEKTRIPAKVSAKRKKLDATIVKSVAAQLIQANLHGMLYRHRVNERFSSRSIREHNLLSL
jgi:hypothetical protein